MSSPALTLELVPRDVPLKKTSGKVSIKRLIFIFSRFGAEIEGSAVKINITILSKWDQTIGFSSIIEYKSSFVLS